MKAEQKSPSSTAARRIHVEAEIAELRRRLDDAEETLDAITSGRVDALVIEHPVEERQVLMLGGMKLADRLLVDRLQQGAVMLSRHGEVLHVNPVFAALLGTTADALTGRPFKQYVESAEHISFTALLDLASS